MIHLIKLAVGARDVEHIAHYQKARADAHGDLSIRRVITRHKPTREEAADGSLYWVIQGLIRCRQRIVGFDGEIDHQGRSFCVIRLDPVLVPTIPTRRGPFQGWRYLKPEDAPPDLAAGDVGDAPAEMLAELRALGLL